MGGRGDSVCSQLNVGEWITQVHISTHQYTSAYISTHQYTSVNSSSIIVGKLRGAFGVDDDAMKLSKRPTISLKVAVYSEGGLPFANA